MPQQPPPHRPVRIAQIGCGMWGTNILRNLVSLPDASVVAVVDPCVHAQERAKTMAPRARTFPSLEQVDLTQVDAAVIASPGPLHTRHGLKCFAAGLHVFVEKPLAMRESDARAMANASALSQRIGFVGHLLLHHPAVRELVRLVQDAPSGRFLRFRAERRSVASTADPDGSPLWSLAPHDLSVLFALASSPMRIVNCAKELSPRNGESFSLRLDNKLGERADIVVSRGTSQKVRRITVECERAHYEFDDTRQGAKLVQLEVATGRRTPVDYDTSREPLREELQSFVSCVQQGRVPDRTSFAEGMRVVSVLEMAERFALAAYCRPPLVEAV